MEMVILILAYIIGTIIVGGIFGGLVYLAANKLFDKRISFGASFGIGVLLALGLTLLGL